MDDDPITEKLGNITSEQMQHFLDFHKKVGNNPNAVVNLEAPGEDLRLEGGKVNTGPIQQITPEMVASTSEQSNPQVTPMAKLARTIQAAKQFRR